MADGDLEAVFKGLAEDAGQAGKDIGESIARFTETTADNEDANVARTLEADSQIAKNAQAVGKQGATASAQAGKLSAQDLIDSGTEFNGTGGRAGNKLPVQGGPPDGILYKRNPQTGDITSYTQYDQNGNAIKRVDLSGRPHGGVPTPHVVEYDHNVNPQTGEVHVREQRHARPARPEEIP